MGSDSVIDSPASASGQKVTTVAPALLFSAGFVKYALEDPLGYGGASEGTIYKVFYNPPEKQEKTNEGSWRVVVAFVSQYCSDISEAFPDSNRVLRIGVDLKHTKTIFEGYLENYREDFKPSDNRFNHGEDIKEDLEDTIELLEELIEDGWTDVVVVTAGRKHDRKKGIIDFIDLNNDYFAGCLPKDAFPFISRRSVVVPHAFILNYFPKGKIIHSRRFGYTFPNLFEYKKASNDFPYLYITFDRSTFDIYNRSTKEVGKIRGGSAHITTADKIIKPLTGPKWPTLKKITKQLEGELSEAGADAQGERIRKKAVYAAERIMQRAKRARERGKDGLADKYEDTAYGILGMVRDNCYDIQDDLNENVKNANPMTKELEKAAEASINNMAITDALPGGHGKTHSTGEVFEPVRKQFKKRLKEQVESLKKTRITSPKYRKKAKKIFETIVNIEVTTTDESDYYSQAVEVFANSSYEYIKRQIEKIVEGPDKETAIRIRETYVVLNIKRMQAIIGLGDPAVQNEVDQHLHELRQIVITHILNLAKSPKAQTHKLTALWYIKDAFSPKVVVGGDTLNLIKNKNLILDGKTHSDRLDSVLKGLIKVRIVVIREPLPPDLTSHERVVKFAEKLKKRYGIALEGDEHEMKDSGIEGTEKL